MSLHKIKPRRWSRRAKQITRGFDSLRLREGLANYRKLKRVEERMDLAQEIADTRGRELALACNARD